MGKIPQDYMAFARKKLSVCHCTDVDLTFSDVCAVCSAHFERRPQNSGLVLSRYIYKMAFEYKDMGYASAVSLVLFVIIMTLSLIEQKKSAVDWEY